MSFKSSHYGYERVPTTPREDDADYEDNIGLTSTERDHVATSSDSDRLHPAIRAALNAPTDPRFDLPTPPTWQRAGLLALIVFLFWLLYRLRMAGLPPLE